jgi:UDP-N-acetylglucosamine:LPS N-acetylglucosamine transferase
MKTTVDRTLRIIVIPLNWGLGHATRLIPIIREFKEKGAEIYFGGSPNHFTLLNQEIDGIEYIEMPYFNIHLSGPASQVISIARQAPSFLYTIIKEHKALRKVVAQKKIDLVISDNCFGAWNQFVYSVFITHQLHINLPGVLKYLSRIINWVNRWFICKYDECLIPDEEADTGFAGILDHPAPKGLKITYTGLLSRFTNKDSVKEIRVTDTPRLLIIISGPEKQRSVFETLIRTQIYQVSGKYEITVIRGLPAIGGFVAPGWYDHLTSKELQKQIANADYIICRSGYSTIMDLIMLGKTAMLVPTPGQTEQTYLADYLTTKGYFYKMEQNSFDIAAALTLMKSKSLQKIALRKDDSRLSEIVDRIIKSAIEKKKLMSLQVVE